MLGKKARLAPQPQNKENILRSSTLTTDSLNYKLRSTLIEKDPNTPDDRIRHLLVQNDDLRKTNEQEREKYRQEMAGMLKRTTKLEESIVGLEKIKIQNQEEIQFLGRKVKESHERCAGLEEEIEELKRRDKGKEKAKESEELTQLKKKIANFEEKNRSLSQESSRMKRQLSAKQIEKIELIASIEKMKKNWNIDVTNLQTEIDSYEQSKIKIVTEYHQYIGKSEAKLKALTSQIAQKDMRIKEIQERALQYEEKIKSNAEAMTNKSNEEVVLIKQKYQEAQEKMKLQMARLKEEGLNKGKEETVRLQSELSQKMLILSELQQKVAEFEESAGKWQSQYKKAAESRDKMETELLETKRQLLKLRQKESQIIKEKLQSNDKEVQFQKQREQRDQLLQKMKEKDAEKEQKIELLMRQKRDVQTRLNKLELELLENSNEKERVQKDLTGLVQRYGELEAQLKDEKRRTSEASQLARQLQVSQTHRQSMQQKLALLTSQLSRQKLSQEETLEQLEANREQYQKILTLQTNKNVQLQELAKCLKEKLKHYEEEYQSDIKSYVVKIKQLEAEKSRSEATIGKLKEEIGRVEEDLAKGRKELQGVKDAFQDKTREYERKLRIAEEEKVYLEVEIEKWKSLRNETAQEYQELKRQNRKLKSSSVQVEQLSSKLKQQSITVSDLETKLKQLNQQKIALIQRHELQLRQAIKQGEQKLEQIRLENTLLQQKIKARLESDLQTVHRQEVMRIRRKSEDCNFTINRYEKKIEELEALVADKGRTGRVEMEGLKRELEKKERDLIVANERNQEVKKKIIVYREELEDLGKKYREKQQRNEELGHRNKKLEQSMTELTAALAKSQTISSQMEQELKGLQFKNSSLTNEVRKLQGTNMRYTYELEQIQKSLKQIEKQKIAEEEKRKSLEKTIEKLETEKVKAEGEIKRYRKSCEDMENSLKFSKKEYEYQGEIKRKAEEVSQLKANIDRIQNELKLSKQKASLTEKSRRELYSKLSLLSNEHFCIHQRQNELEFLLTLYEKLKSFLEIFSKLKQDRTSMQKELKTQNEQFLKSFSKNYDQNLTFKDNYNLLYKKYLKYKEAYIYCKTKLERYKVDVVNDQRFTEEILTHCKTLIYKFE